VKQSKVLVALIVVIAGLFALNYWDDWKSIKDKNHKELSTKLFVGSPADIVLIQFDSESLNEDESTTSVQITKQDKQWQITKPLNVLADQRNVENLLKMLFDYNYSKVISKEAGEKDKFGFDKPNRTIALTNSAGETKTLQIGMKAPVGYDVYSTLLKKPEVYVGSQHLLVATGKSLFDFRHKAVTNVDIPKIQKFTYFRRQKGDPLKFDFSKGDSEDFTFVDQNGSSYEGDRASIRDFWEDIESLRAKKFLDNPGAKLQDEFSNPDVAVSWNEGGENRALLFLKKNNVYFVATDPAKLVVELPDNSHVRIEKNLINFRNRKVFDFETATISEVKIDGDTFKNVKGSWFDAFEGNKKGDAKEAPHVRALMLDLEFSQTFAYIQLKDKMIEELPKAPAHQITLTFKAGAKRTPEVIDIYPVPDEDKYRYIRHTSGAYLYKIDTKILQSLTASKHSDINEKSHSENDGHDHGQEGEESF